MTQSFPLESGKPSSHTEHFTSDTFSHQMCSFSLNLAILRNISWLVHNLTNSDTVYPEIESDFPD